MTETPALRCALARAAASHEPPERQAASHVDDVELLGRLLRTGGRRRDAERGAAGLLERFGSLRALSTESALALQSVPGVGPARAAVLLAGFELGRRVAAEPLRLGRPLRGPDQVHRHFLPRLREWRRESFHALLLDGRHRLICVETISVGTLTASLVHPREVFREAIRRAAAAMLIVHNHPSGDPRPSSEDREVTERLTAAGELLGIRVLDHVIVAEQGYFSFREMEPAASPADPRPA